MMAAAIRERMSTVSDSDPEAAKAPAANSSESPGRNGVTTKPVSQKTIRNRRR